MLLSKLLNGVEVVEIKNMANVDIEKITDKTNEVTDKSMFCCIVGEKIDSHIFVGDLIKKGCKVFLVEKFLNDVDCSVIQIKVNSVRKQMCIVISNFYENCHKKMDLIGVTGTNGKTSITFILKNAFEKLKCKVGIIGTTGCYIGNKKIETNLTTPDCIDLHKIFYEMYKSGVEIVVMEVSAHSIYFDKIFGLKFKYGIFTNLTQDHLDFFGNMDKYANTKYKFLKEYCDKVVLNIDDEYGSKFKLGKRVKTYSLKNRAYIYAKNIEEQLQLLKFDVVCEDEIVNFEYHNSGVYNIYNILATVVILKDYGYSLKKIKKAISSTPQIKGRLDIINVKEYIVCIDYAHTPDALLNVLATLRKFTNDLIVVFGSSGNRDSLKRKDMGIIVNRFADYIILTSDNPRYENEYDIFVDLSKDINKPFAIEKDRAKAIKYANEIAHKDSIILICGKGVEEYQDVKAQKIEYSDYKEIEKYM